MSGLHEDQSRYKYNKTCHCRVVKAMSPENLTSAFKKAGIYPFNGSVMSQEQVAPSVIYRETEESDQPADADDSDADSDSTINYFKVTAPVT